MSRGAVLEKIIGELCERFAAENLERRFTFGVHPSLFDDLGDQLSTRGSLNRVALGLQGPIVLYLYGIEVTIVALSHTG